MIIFGTRGVTSTIAQGTFNCPQCGTTRTYKHKKVTRFFTLYFIPIIPMGRLGDYVECQTCKGTFVPRVLEYQATESPDKIVAEYEKAIKHSMILIMLADGHIDDNELDTVQQIIDKFSNNPISREELNAQVSEIEQNPEDISTYLQHIAPSLNEHGKEMIIKCALAVAAADGHVDQSEIDLVKAMAVSMEMSGSHVKGILSEMLEPAS